MRVSGPSYHTSVDTAPVTRLRYLLQVQRAACDLASRLMAGSSSRYRSNHLRSSTSESRFPGEVTNPQPAVMTSEAPLGSEAMTGRPHAIASSKTNASPSAKDGNTNTWDSRYRSRSSSEEHGGNHLIPGGKDRSLLSASIQEPTSTSSAFRNSAFDQASISSGTPFRSETCPTNINRSGPGLLVDPGVQNSSLTPYGASAISL